MLPLMRLHPVVTSSRRSAALTLWLGLALLLGAAPIGAAAGWPGGDTPGKPSLESDLPSGQLIGTQVVFSVTPADERPRDHRFRVWSFGKGRSVLLDFGSEREFQWAARDAGLYVVRVDSRELESGDVQSDAMLFWVRPPHGHASVLPTAHPLVALYSGRLDFTDRSLRRRCRKPQRPCEMRVIFQAEDGERVHTTPAQAASRHAHTSFWIAGLREQTSYALRHEVLDAAGRHVAFGPALEHKAGSVEVAFPEAIPRIERGDPAEETDPVLLVTPILDFSYPYATDLQGRVVWYDRNAEQSTLTRANEGGTFLELVQRSDPNSLEILREIDLAGNLLLRTDIERVNEQLVAMGEDPVTTFHHDARRLPGGRIAVIGLIIRELVDVQGPGAFSVLGDNIVVLDRNLQVEWVWNAFEKLDVTRQSVLGLSCVVGQGGCRGTRPGIISNDWTHSNSLDYSPEDGHLILSVRNQDWVVKIDYADGKGSGDVIWRLGNEGDFALDSDDPFPWFSHAHDPNLLSANRLVIYDNGNTACARMIRCRSRGQVYELDEVNRTARILTEADLERNSFALGSAQALRGGGGYHFGSGIFALADGSVGSTAEEVGVDGVIRFSLFQRTLAYRSFRMRDLYTPPPSRSEQADAFPPSIWSGPLARWLRLWAGLPRRVGTWH